MSHSTQGGFRLPPTAFDSGLAFFSIVSALAFPLLQSRAVAVGSRFTCADSFGSPLLLNLPAVRFTASSATGVCSRNPDALSEVIHARSSVKPDGVSSGKHSPPRIIPQRGQVSENGSKPPASENWRVLHKHEAWSNLAHDTAHFRPKPATLSVNSSAFAGCTDVLAWESSADGVNASVPRLAIEGSNVIPDGEPWQDSVSLPLQQHLSAVRFNLDSTDAGMSEKRSAKDTSPCSSKKV